jgi:hypothetical protein
MFFNTLLIITAIGIVVPILGITGLGIFKFIKNKRR